MSSDLVPFALLLALVALDRAALRWGVSSVDDPASAEWDRRRAWRGFRSG